MTTKKIAYLITTALFALAVLPGAAMDIMQPDMIVEVASKIQIPLFLLTLIGVWKILGVLALARPRFERLNEWAYAGFFFDLSGAAYWHSAAGDAAGAVPPLVLLTLLMASYVLRGAARDEAVAQAV